MKIFVDTADIDEIKEAMKSGVVDGVTTNPSLIKKAQEKHGIDDMKAYIKNILDTAGPDKPVSLEVTETDYEGMKREADVLKKHFGRYKNFTIKIPVNPSMKFKDAESFDGLRLIKELSDDGIDVNTTVVMSPEQAILAAKAGASYVSPFAGRIDDFLREHKIGKERGKDFPKSEYYPAEGTLLDGNEIHDNGVVSGVDCVAKIVQIFDEYDFDCEVLAASARNTRQVREFMLAGAHVATLPLHVVKALTAHYKTVEGVVSFAEDTVDDYKELLEEKGGFSISFGS
jgi:transaldolase